MVDDSFAKAIADLDGIAAAFEASGPLLQIKVSVATRRTALTIEALSKQTVPVDTGATKNSIGSDIAETGSGDGYGIDVESGPQTDYAMFIEVGTERMPPRPFMGPAFDQAVPPWLDALGVAVDPLGDR